jgi:hypothetical protein
VIAALFVEKDGVYYGLEGVDPWDKDRDARLYAGPWPVVAHPPCERWGAFWYGGMHLASKGIRKHMGDDGGCFAHALWAVRTFGGVLEHPANSRAFHWFGMPKAKDGEGWTDRDRWDGASCHVEQGHYGHRARKATWLYACRTDLPALTHGPSTAIKPVQFMSGQGKERSRTPNPFRDVLLSIARSVIRRSARAA